MTERAKSIDVSDAPEILSLAEDVRRAGEPRVSRRGDEDLAMVIPIRSVKKRRQKTEADYAAFRGAAGGWADVDTDKLIDDIYEDRRRSTRAPVDL